MNINDSIDIARKFAPNPEKKVLRESEAVAAEPHPTMMGLRVAQQQGQVNPLVQQQQPAEEEQKPDPSRVVYWTFAS